MSIFEMAILLIICMECVYLAFLPEFKTGILGSIGLLCILEVASSTVLDDWLVKPHPISHMGIVLYAGVLFFLSQHVVSMVVDARKKIVLKRRATDIQTLFSASIIKGGTRNGIR